MASHHLHFQHHCQNHVTVPTTTCCPYNLCCTQSHHPSPPPATPQVPIDPLLQSLVSLLQQQQQQQQQPDLFSTCLNQPKGHKNRLQKPNLPPRELHFQQEDEPQQTQFVLSSLFQRINTLESSLNHFSTSSSKNNNYYPSNSLRDTAARVIQTHFRAFLVHRSRTLRQLKELAFIKSSFNSLKSSVSTKTHFDCEVVSRKAMDLLIKLDSVQGCDPMIRDGKRSVTRDLLRFLEFIDGFAVKRHELPYKSARNLRVVVNDNGARALNAKNCYGGNGDSSENQKQMVDKLRKRVEKISGFLRVCENDHEDVELEGFQQFIDNNEGEENRGVAINGKHGFLVKKHDGQPRVKKTVSFVENGNVYRVISDSDESILHGDGSFTDGSDSGDDQGEVVENHLNKAQERKRFAKGGNDEVHLENGRSTCESDSKQIPCRNMRNDGDYETNGCLLDQNGSLVFSAPVPVKMESRADLMKKREAVKTVG